MSDLGIAHTATSECINILSDRDIVVKAKNNRDTSIFQNDTETIIKGNKKVTVEKGHSEFKVNTGTHTEEIQSDTKITIKDGTYQHDVAAKTAAYHVKGKITETYDADQATIVTGEIKITATTQILLQVGDSSLLMKSDGTIELSGKSIKISGKIDVNVGVGTQNVLFDTEKVATSGAAINSTAKGMHEIVGSMVKIN
jgi:type VI secretion system secreted protein VgrG